MCNQHTVQYKYRVFFLTGTPIKKIKYGKPNLAKINFSELLEGVPVKYEGW